MLDGAFVSTGRIPGGVTLGSHVLVVLMMSSYLADVAAHAQVAPPRREAVLEILVTAGTRAVPQAQVITGGKTAQTDANGRLTLHVAPGPIENRERVSACRRRPRRA
jgi:hypothetical protein